MKTQFRADVYNDFMGEFMGVFNSLDEAKEEIGHTLTTDSKPTSGNFSSITEYQGDWEESVIVNKFYFE